MSKNSIILPMDYSEWITNLKKRIAGARQRIILAANKEQIKLYHEIGKDILNKQKKEGWGTKVIDRIAIDLREAFPEMKGFSASNLKYMRYFAKECPDIRIGQQSADLLPWFHIIAILTKISDSKIREWYAVETVAQAWSRDLLIENIKTDLYLRQGAAITNFKKSLPINQAGMAVEILKDPYNFDFLGLGNEAPEREIENALVQHITRFLLELGAGFAFMGRQFKVEVEGDEFFIDLLFYHTRLKCYVVVELKAESFKPEYAGKLNFYLAVVDAQIKAPDDKPTIGLLLCKTKKKLIAEYALSGIDKPIGVAEYQLVCDLPQMFERCLPTIEEIEAELSLKHRVDIP